MDLKKTEIQNFVETGTKRKILPLQTIQSMSERWGRSRQAVSNWAMRHNDFPKPLEGVIEQTDKTPRVYPLHEVEKYEKLKGLGKN